MSSNLYIIFDAGEFAELSFDDDIMLMSISDDFLRAFDVLFEVIVRTIEHDGRETIIDAGFAGLEIRTMIEVQGDRNIVDLEGCLYEVTEIRALGILACASGSLEDNRGVQLCSCFRDTLYNLHVVDVESTDGETALISFLEHFFRSN